MGRFLNADTFASTGQGFIGNNMFVYCNNNAVNSSDSLGARPVSTLERFGDKKIPVPPKRSSQKNKQNNKPGKKNGTSVKDKITHHINTTQEVERKIQEEQTKLIQQAAKTTWQAYAQSVELQTQKQLEQDLLVRQIGSVYAKNPLLAVDAATNATSIGVAIIEYSALAAGIAIPVGGQIALLAVGSISVAWSVYRHSDSVRELLEE